jgi:hypothetical protein
VERVVENQSLLYGKVPVKNLIKEVSAMVWGLCQGDVLALVN